VLLSLLCAAAFSPLIVVGAGISAAAAVAGIGILSSVGSGVLTGVITAALDQLRPAGARRAGSAEDLEAAIAQQIQAVFAAAGADAAALRTEIAGVLKEINAGGTALREAFETGNEQVRSTVVAALGELSTDFAELRFLLGDVFAAAGEIQASQDEHGAQLRVIIDKVDWVATQARLTREETAGWRAADEPGDPGTGAAPARWAGGCPYRGLQPFTEADAEVFYGRERLTAELAGKLAARAGTGVLVVTGASGAGKSSLLRAGLLPALARGLQVPGSQDWPRMVITPTARPLTELATWLAAVSGGSAAAIRRELAADPGQAHLAVRQAVVAHAVQRGARDGGGARLVLIVDQFEELFTLNPDDGGAIERTAFITALCAAATNPAGPAGEPPALVLIAVRGDFWDECAAYPELARALQESQFVVGPMTESDLRRAITGPAEAAGLQIETALTGTILADLRSADAIDAGALPLLSQAMLLTWENREGTRLTSHGYGAAGGVGNAVAASADAVYRALSPAQQALARQVLRQMIVVRRDRRLSRRPVTRQDLYRCAPAGEAGLLDAVLEAFAAKRLFILNERSAEISHDALLHAWAPVGGWLADDQASVILYSQLAEDAAGWRGHRDDPSFLYRGTQLAAVSEAAARWAADPARHPALGGVERDFLTASRHAANRSARRRRVLAATLSVLVIAAGGGAGVAITAARSAASQRDTAVSGKLAVQSEALDATDPVTAARLAAAAWRIDPTTQAREAMLDVLAQPGRAVIRASTASHFVFLYALALNQAGSVLATGGTDGATLWDVATQRQIGTAMTDPSGQVTSVAFNPAGTILATGGFGGQVRFWNVATHRQIGTAMTASAITPGSSGRKVNAIAFSPDGTVLASGGDDGTTRLWDVATHLQIGTAMIASGRSVSSVAFSPDGKVLATAGDTARLWDVTTHRQIGAPMAADTQNVNAVAFRPDGRVLATASDDHATRLWDVATHRQVGVAMINPDGSATSVAFNHAGTVLASGSYAGTTRLWDPASGQELGEPFSGQALPVDDVPFFPDGKVLATASLDGTVWLWDVTIVHQIGAPLPSGGRLNAGDFSPDGTLLATAADDHTVRVWDVATHRQVGAPIVVGAVAAETVAFSPGGTMLATADKDGVVRLWDVASHRRVGTAMAGHLAVFSPGGKILATVVGAASLRLWDVATQRPIGKPIRGARAAGITFSPHGTFLAVADLAYGVRLWNVATHRQVGRRITVSGGLAAGVAFSPDGTKLATANFDGTAQLWDVQTQQQIGTPLEATTGGVPGGATRDVVQVAFSPDGTLLATASGDGTVRLWDVATRDQIGLPLTAGPSTVDGGVGFSPNGRVLGTLGSDGRMRLWDVAFPRDLVGPVCGIGGSLPPAQWRTYAAPLPYRPTCG
jgi:WD40 repeat protein